MQFDNIELILYNISYKDILEEMVNGESKSNFIHSIKERLEKSKDRKELEIDSAYLVKVKNEIIGYIYLSGISKKTMYLEYLIRKKYRGMGLGNLVLTSVSDAIFLKYPGLKSIKLNIDKSNLASMKLAESAGFFSDEDDYQNEKIDFIKDNPYIIIKEK